MVKLLFYPVFHLLDIFRYYLILFMLGHHFVSLATCQLLPIISNGISCTSPCV